jgi:hypothetical protein
MMEYSTEEELELEFKQMREDEVTQDKEDARLLSLILASCKKRVSKVWYDQMIAYMDLGCGDYFWDFRITDKPCTSGHKQKELTRFKHVYLWQSCGISGDDWSGEMSIPIRHGKYLTYNFDC